MRKLFSLAVIAFAASCGAQEVPTRDEAAAALPGYFAYSAGAGTEFRDASLIEIGHCIKVVRALRCDGSFDFPDHRRRSASIIIIKHGDGWQVLTVSPH